MCDYSLHAVASRPAQVGETLITTTFPRTTTRGFASESEPNSGVHASGYRTGFRRQRKISKPMAVAESHRIARWKIQRVGSTATPAPGRSLPP